MIKKIADRIVKYNDTSWEMNINKFDWIPGVGLFGIWTAYKNTEDKRYFEFLENWAKMHLLEAYDNRTINSAAPLLTITELYSVTKNEEYRKVCTDMADYLINEAQRTECGGLMHTVTEDVPEFSEQMWADTLFMACLFLLKFGKIIENNQYVDFAVNQLKIHLKHLRDNDSGLFYHGYSCITKGHLSGVRWGRANAWIIYSTAVFLEELMDFDGRDEVESILKEHIIALAKVQRENGAFGTVLDNPQSYDEISATGGIAAGIKKAYDIRVIDRRDVYEKAVCAIKNAVSENGEVLGVSTGTPIMDNEKAYMDIPCCVTLYGQALAILGLGC